MQLVKLSQWQDMFPDGVSSVNYNRIRTLILRLGLSARVKLAENDHDQLERELSRLERESPLILRLRRYC